MRFSAIVALLLIIPTDSTLGCNSQTTPGPGSSTARTTRLRPLPSRGPNNPPYVSWEEQMRNNSRVSTTPGPASSAPETGAGVCQCGVVMSAPGSSGNATSTRFGVSVAKNEFPWQVALVFYGKTKPFCSGTIISSRTVLTAAHCYTNASLFKVVVNERTLDLEDGQYSVTPISFMKHPNFNASSLDYDLALVTLAVDLTWSRAVSPVCLPDQPDQENRAGTVTGWGTMYADGQQSMVLQKMDVMVLNNSRCASRSGGLYSEADLTWRMVCAEESGLATCVGDSGSPLLVKSWNGTRYQQVGVFSWGAGCRQNGAPGVYSRVFSVKKWIQDNMTGSTCPSGALLDVKSLYNQFYKARVW